VLTYSGDTEWVDELIPAGRDADLFICEAYFFDKVMKYHIDYSTLARRLPDIGAKRTIVTHMSAELLAARTRSRWRPRTTVWWWSSDLAGPRASRPAHDHALPDRAPLARS